MIPPTTPAEEAAALLCRIFEALARQNGKTLSRTTRDSITHACELLASSGEELDTFFDDLPTPPRQSPAEAAIDDPNF